MKNDIERKAWFSSFEVLWQKAQVIWVRVTWWDYKLLETKQSLRRFFVELDKTMSSCPSPVLWEQVHNNIKKMDKMDLINFAKNLTDLSTQAREIQEQIDQTCGKK